MADLNKAARLHTAMGGVAGAADDLDRVSRHQPTHAGWYRDPDDRARQRFWDGATWSAPVTAGTAATADSVPQLLAG